MFAVTLDNARWSLASAPLAGLTIQPSLFTSAGNTQHSSIYVCVFVLNNDWLHPRPLLSDSSAFGSMGLLTLHFTAILPSSIGPISNDLIHPWILIPLLSLEPPQNFQFMMTTPAMTSDIPAGQVESRILKGVLIDFGPGAGVLSIKHPSDYSAIQLSCNMPHRNAENLAAYMFAFFREPVGLSRIHIISDPDACPVIAQVQVKDPGFAARIKSKFDGYVKFVPKTGISIKRVTVDIKYEASDIPPHIPAIRRHLLHDRHARLRMQEGSAVYECAVCLTEAEDPYRTACGHLYCGTCFDSQCRSVTKDDIPIRCLGNSGKCSRTFLLPELKLILQPKSFEHFLERSFTIYIRTTETVQECPNFHCHGTYRPSTDGSVILCFKCSTPICTTCQAPSHSGMTCAMYRRVGSVVYETWGFNKDIRKCPRCRNLIEKTGGCERVDCLCGAGFCWRCMELWDEEGRCRCVKAVGGEVKKENESLREEGVGRGGEGGQAVKMYMRN